MKTSSKSRLLFLDDDEFILDSLKRLFHEPAYEIYTTTHQEEALRIAEERELALIISDQRMPGITGTDFLSHIRQVSPDTVRILITGYSDIKTVVESINHAAIHRYVEKPWDDEQLKKIVEIGLNQYASKKKRDRLSSNIHKQSITDELTGLYNYRYFSNRIKQEVERAIRYKRQVSLLMIDLDGFKAVNDQLGHLQGDSVLKKIAEIMVALNRTHDITCRYGGDEFAVILPETDISGAIVVAEKHLAAVRKHKFKSSNPSEIFPPITLSIGVASLGNGVDEPKMLIQSADKAMYIAKSSGKNQAQVAKNNQKNTI